MLHPQRARRGIRVQCDLAEAAVEMGFALVRYSESHPVAGEASRALDEAVQACEEGKQRLFGLPLADASRLGCQLKQLRLAIESARKGAASGGRSTHGTGKVIEMPSRRI